MHTEITFRYRVLSYLSHRTDCTFTAGICFGKVSLFAELVTAWVCVMFSEQKLDSYRKKATASTHPSCQRTYILFYNYFIEISFFPSQQILSFEKKKKKPIKNMALLIFSLLRWGKNISTLQNHCLSLSFCFFFHNTVHEDFLSRW